MNFYLLLREFFRPRTFVNLLHKLGIRIAASGYRGASAKSANIIAISFMGGDTFFFARQGFKVWAVEYTEAGADNIKQKAEALGLSKLITVLHHDVRKPLPLPAEQFAACFSHMLYCMAFTTEELVILSSEVRRVLKPNGINIYTVRSTSAKHYGSGIHRGEDRFEANGFIVHFFDKKKIELLANGYDILDVTDFKEGDLPRKLFRVKLQKSS